MTCSFAKEYSSSSYTGIENEFIITYMPLAQDKSLKVYLYGLFLCSHPEQDKNILEIANTLQITEQDVIDAFDFWEEFGLLSVLSKSPLTVSYLPIKNASHTKPRKYKTEKYSEFTKSIQTMITDRMISTNEYTEYFNIMETCNIKPESMLMIVKYCVDVKGSDIGYRYISTVVKDFANRGIITVDKIESELASYSLHSQEIEKVLKALSSHKKPDAEDQNYYKKWTEELSFEPENIVFAAKKLKKGSMAKLDAFLMELYSAKCFSKDEINLHSNEKQHQYELALKINRALSVYVDVLDTEIDEYISKWIAFGFDDDTLLLIANQCFKSGKNQLQNMNDCIEHLRIRGFIDLSSVHDYYETQKKNDEFITKILLTCGINRRPTPWDRENLTMWRGWNFSNDMILEASKLSAGKNSPLAYMNGVLSKWKNNGIFNITEIEKNNTNDNEMSIEDYNREYAKRRSLAASKAQKNIEIAMKLEGFTPIYERLSSIEKDLAFAEMSGNTEKLSLLEKEKNELKNTAENLLKTINLCLSDLSPKYQCDKCKDTGYIGSNRCDCFNKKV